MKIYVGFFSIRIAYLKFLILLNGFVSDWISAQPRASIQRNYLWIDQMVDLSNYPGIDFRQFMPFSD